jgi:hypothetical protein
MFTPKDGGFTLYYLYYILSKIFDKKCIFYKNYENIYFKYFTFISNLQSKYNKEHNIIYIEKISNINYNIKYKFINNNKYKLVCSILHIINTDNNIDHVVVGYICNKKYYIYDSNNINIEIDWRYKQNILNINNYNGNYKFESYINIYIKNI